MTSPKRDKKSLFLAAALAALLATAFAADDKEDALLMKAKTLFKPLPADASTDKYPVTPERIALGRALFFETRVSTDGRAGAVHRQQRQGLAAQRTDDFQHRTAICTALRRQSG
jgi:cytochrome c peroxidase